MEIISNIPQLKAYLTQKKAEGYTIGFCPTMGFLHEGHLALVKQAQAQAKLTLVSIYVNQSQFNNPKDFENYPRDLTRDIQLLSDIDTDVLWLPEKTELEAIPLDFVMDYKDLDQVMEGKYRPGHFKGVCEVVYRLLKAVQPQWAFFGTKDFQQLSIIEELVMQNNLPLEIIPVETLRAQNGLALSSRNARLTPEAQKEAQFIYQTLQNISIQYPHTSWDILQTDAVNQLKKKGIEVEYLELCQLKQSNPRIFIAAYYNGVRLIDNIILNN